jgi:hypothetical protein
MVWGVFNVVFYWYNLALHYIAIGGGVAEILIGTWIALATAFLYLVVTIYRYQSR